MDSLSPHQSGPQTSVEARDPLGLEQLPGNLHGGHADHVRRRVGVVGAAEHCSKLQSRRHAGDQPLLRR